MQESSRYITDDSGRSFFLHEWIPDDPGSIRGVVQVVHGMMEHAGRYSPMAEYLTSKGFAVIAEDHFGHGKTAAGPKELGHLEGKKGWHGILDQMIFVLSASINRYPGVPHVLLGHSMGSMLARHFAILHGDMIDAIILSGTDHTTRPLILAGRMLASGSSLIYGRHYRNRMINYLVYKTFNHHFKPNRTHFDWLTTDNEVVDRYIEDPLCGYPSTSGFYQGMFHGLHSINQSRLLSRIPYQLPVLIIAGKKDAVGKFSKGPQKIASQLQEAGVKDVTVHLYQDGRHEMHNERNRLEVLTELTGWIVMKTTGTDEPSIKSGKDDS